MDKKELQRKTVGFGDRELDDYFELKNLTNMTFNNAARNGLSLYCKAKLLKEKKGGELVFREKDGTETVFVI